MDRRGFLAGLALMAAAHPAAFAQTSADGAAIRDVIGSQLDAFLADDDQRAWSHASPGIQQMFRTVDIFMTMVRQGYPPVHRPKARAFEALRDTPNGPEQDVRLTDAAGEQWIAIYTMEQQPDGSWKIAGCRLVKAPPSV
jgi:hypothetical protein